MKKNLDCIDKILHGYTKKTRNPRDLEIWFYDYFLKLMKYFSRNSSSNTLTDCLVLLLNLFRTDFSTKVGKNIGNISPIEMEMCELVLKEELKSLLS